MVYLTIMNLLGFGPGFGVIVSSENWDDVEEGIEHQADIEDWDCAEEPLLEDLVADESSMTTTFLAPDCFATFVAVLVAAGLELDLVLVKTSSPSSSESDVSELSLLNFGSVNC